MVNPNSGWLHTLIRVGGTALVAVVFAMGCATSTTPDGAGAGASGMVVQTIEDVSVERDGTDSVVWLGGLIDPIYSVSTQVESNLIVVDLVGVEKPVADGLMSEARDDAGQIAAYNGVVDLITLATFDEGDDIPLTRLEIVTAVPGHVEVLSTGDGLEIRVIPGEGSAIADAMTGSSDLAASDSTGSVPAAPALWGSDDSSMDVAVENGMDAGGSVAPPPSATQLTSVSATETEEGVLVSLQANGEIGSLEAFTLTDPARLVVDLPGLTIAEGVSNLSIDSEYVSGVRLGAHDGKIRIVLDGGVNSDDFQGRQIMPGTTGLWIAIGDGEDLTTAMNGALAASEAAWLASNEATEETPFAEFASAPIIEEEMGADAEVVDEPEEAMIASLELAEVYGLHYERTDGMDRTAILADEALGYTLSAPDATTLVVSLEGAMISDAASDRIFPKSGGPISLINAFQQPEVEIPEVRIVFTRAPNLEPVVSRRGSMLFVDFEDVGIAAAPPPAFPNAGMDENDLSPVIVASVAPEMASDAMAVDASEEAANPMGPASMPMDDTPIPAPK